MRLDELEIVESPHVSLTRVEPDGSVVDVAFWRIDGKIVMHPERLRRMPGNANIDRVAHVIRVWRRP
jgi:hypothetical protein